MSDIHDDHLLWIDLETTGSASDKDCIIEVGAVLTTTDLTELGSFTSLVRPNDRGLGRLMLNKFVREMHTANGLLDELLNSEAKTPHDVGQELIAWATDLGAQQGRTVLAGSGVAHFDRRFLDKFMPQVTQLLRYWVIDIGVIRRAHDMWVGTEVSKANDAKTHRALDDVYCHLEEARAFKALWSGGANVAPRVQD